MSRVISVGFSEERGRSDAEVLAKQLGLALDNHAYPRLSVMPDRLALLLKGCEPLSANFNSHGLSRRREAGKSQGLIRACKPQLGLSILDVTAGWGRDAAILASFGASVTMVERHPVMHALLFDALHRLQLTESRLVLSLVHANACDYLDQLAPSDYPDVIYIDPMHPTRQKSALVKKDMQVLQQLIGADEDADALLQKALHIARLRVVLKWPQRLPPLFPPNHSIEGKTVRFDVYTGRSITANIIY